MRLTIEENIVETYRDFYIIREIINEDVYYVVYDDRDIKHGGALHSVDTCRKWIDMICSDRRRNIHKQRRRING